MRSSLLAQLRRWAAVTSIAVLAAVGSVGCADVDETTDGTDDAVTDIPQTAVQRQTIGNCWLYSTVGWIESMELTTTGQPRKLSEDWLTYWSWYEVITDPTLFDAFSRFTDDHFETGGWYEISAHLVERYGVADAAFKAPDIKKALERVRAAFDRGGPLASLTAQRDGAKVRAVLDAAFELPPATRAAIDGVFGRDGARAIDTSSSRAGSRRAIGLRAPSEVSIFLPNPATHARERRTLEDAVGHDRVLSLSDLVNGRAVRKGPYAWRAVNAPMLLGDYRDWVRRMQRALNDGYAVPANWFVDQARTSDGTHYYGAPRTTKGRHASLITDYQAENVPGFGRLPLGVVEKRPEALAASLADGVQVTFIRLKNSWGKVGVEGGATFSIPGYVDLADSYFSAEPTFFERGVYQVYLPPGY
jgi:hypothetical protein